jgi:PhzF family phenazine biosynthesis protein
MLKYFVIDAFTDSLFSGNPAGVCVCDEFPDDEIMQKIAGENRLPETAFLKNEGKTWHIRWFTPEWEMDLCGHATLASGFAVLNLLGEKINKVDFTSQSGPLAVTRIDGDRLQLDFPSRPPETIEITEQMRKAVRGLTILGAYKSRDFMFELESEETIKNFDPDLPAAAKIPGLVDFMVTAKGTTADFVSRFFTPEASITEDPVTGSAHCTLVPFWAKKLGKSELFAKQLSAREGKLYCKDLGERVTIAGGAALYLEGRINL